MKISSGLYLVSCPIGNVQDITLRALAVLKTAELIAAEDTRVTGRLLAAHDISSAGRLLSCHEHNEDRRVGELLAHLGAGRTVALVTDAGTPSVSDPGFRLVQAAIDQDIPVIPVPGVSAAVTALSASGLPTDAFAFAGFLPRKPGKREKRLQELAGQSATLIFYESPHRIRQTLADMRQCWGDRPAVIGREMTKPYEEFLRGRLSELEAALADKDRIRGEITLVVAGAGNAAPVQGTLDLAAEVCASRESTAALARKLAARYGLNRNQLYEEITRLRQANQDGLDEPWQ